MGLSTFYKAHHTIMFNGHVELSTCSSDGSGPHVFLVSVVRPHALDHALRLFTCDTTLLRYYLGKCSVYFAGHIGGISTNILSGSVDVRKLELVGIQYMLFAIAAR